MYYKTYLAYKLFHGNTTCLILVNNAIDNANAICIRKYRKHDSVNNVTQCSLYHKQTLH